MLFASVTYSTQLDIKLDYRYWINRNKLGLSDHNWSLVALYRFASVLFQGIGSANIFFCVNFCEYPYF